MRHLRVSQEEGSREAGGCNTTQCRSICGWRQNVHCTTCRRLHGCFDWRIELTPEASAFGIGVAIVTGVESHARPAQEAREASYWVFQGPERRFGDGDDTETSINDSKGFKEGRLAFFGPPAGTRDRQMRTGGCSEDAVDWLRRERQETHIACFAHRINDTDIVAGVRVRLRPRARTATEIENDSSNW